MKSSFPVIGIPLLPVLSCVLCGLAGPGDAMAEAPGVQPSKDAAGGSGTFSINDVRPIPDASALPPPRVLVKRTEDDVYLAPFDVQTRLLPSSGGKGKGHAHFLDTYHGMRVQAVFRGLEAGKYLLRTDGLFHAARHMQMECKPTAKTNRKKNSESWKVATIEIGEDGVGRMDQLYPGIGTEDTPYTIFADGFADKGKYLRIALDGFSLVGRWLILDRLNVDGTVAAESVLCGVLDYMVSAAWKIESIGESRVWGGVIFDWNDYDHEATLRAVLRGGVPGTRYRLAVHEWEDCSAPLEGSAGPPYAPERNPKVSYPKYRWPLVEGNLGTYVADKKGRIVADKPLHHAMTEGSPESVWGHAILVYAVEKAAGKGKPAKEVPVACGVAVDPPEEK